MTHAQREIHRKKRVIEYADQIGNVHRACRYFGGCELVVLDITRGRVKPVTQGKGFGPKRVPTGKELKALDAFGF